MIQIPTPQEVLETGGDSLVQEMLGKLQSLILCLDDTRSYIKVPIAFLAEIDHEWLMDQTITRVMTVLGFKGWQVELCEEKGGQFLKVSHPPLKSLYL